MIEIPWQQLSQDALVGLIEEFIGRDGTDYGMHEFSLAEKVEHLLPQIKNGQVLILFDETIESTTLMTRLDYQNYLAEM